MRFYFVSTYEIERTNFSNGLLRQGTLLQKHSFLFFQVASPRLLSFSFKSRLAFPVRLWLTPAVLMPLRRISTISPPPPLLPRGGGEVVTHEAVQYILNFSKGTLLLSSSLSLVTVHHAVVNIPYGSLVIEVL
jgi:hypothetical protein